MMDGPERSQALASVYVDRVDLDKLLDLDLVHVTRVLVKYYVGINS